MKLYTFLFTILFASLASWNFVNAKKCIPKQKGVSTTENKFIKVKGEKMSLGIYGKNNKQTIVFLSGLNIISPIMTYKPLAEALSDEYRFVIVESFGHGFSDVSKNPRTIENIVNELHSAVRKAGIKKFYLSGHSLGGLYGLYYADQYPEEVLGFIGFDNSAQNGEEALIGYESVIQEKVDCNALYKNNTWAGDSEIAQKTKQKNIDKLKSSGSEYYEYSEKDIETFISIFEKSYCNDNIVSEYQNTYRSYEVSKGIKFPKSVPTLQILSSETCEEYSDWITIHEERIYESPLNEIIIMDGSHNIMFDQKQAVVDKIKSWIKQIENYIK